MPAGLKPADAPSDALCSACQRTQADLGAPLKVCAGCKTTLYCSKKCQDASRKAHRGECQTLRSEAAASASAAPTAPTAELESVLELVQATGSYPITSIFPVPAYTPPPPASPGQKMPPGLIMAPSPQRIMAICDAERAHRNLCVAAMSTNIQHPEVIRCMFLHAGYAPRTYLSSLPAPDAARQLIDAFRLRCEDEYVFNMEYTGLYSQEPGEPRKAFWTYLDLAEKRKVVPTWWNLSTRRRVEQMALDEKGTHCIRHAVERNDIVELYGGDGLAPLKLRGVAEKVYGRPVTNHF